MRPALAIPKSDPVEDVLDLARLLVERFFHKGKRFDLPDRLCQLAPIYPRGLLDFASISGPGDLVVGPNGRSLVPLAPSRKDVATSNEQRAGLEPTAQSSETKFASSQGYRDHRPQETPMLKANVGLSRKLSKDYNSTGFTVNLDGEITAPLNDPELFLQQMRELWDLAEESLSQRIERSQSDSEIASRDDDPAPSPPSTSTPAARPASANGTREHANGHAPEAATNKQIQFLLTLGKRQQLDTLALEKRIAKILGRSIGLYDLTKKDAAIAISFLTGEPEENPRSRPGKTR